MAELLKQLYGQKIKIIDTKKVIVEKKEIVASLEDQRRIAYDDMIAEEHDVEKLHGLSITSIMATLQNKKNLQLERETREAIRSRKKYNELTHRINDLNGEIEDLKKIVIGEELVLKHFDEAYNKKKEMLINDDLKTQTYLLNYNEQKLVLDEQIKRSNVAVATTLLLDTLSQGALNELEGAKKLGLWDIFGGGFFVTAAKRNKMTKAQKIIDQLSDQLIESRGVLKQYFFFNTVTNLDEYLSFADYYFDGLLVDIFVQNKINAVYNRLIQLQKDIKALLNILSDSNEKQKSELDTLEYKFESFVISRNV